MGHNSSRRARERVDAGTQFDVDQYKARSIWGSWRGMDRAARDRYFNADEIAWLNRYGSRLDQLSCLAVESRNEREKHFIGVCLGHHPSATDRERLWLRAQMVVRYEASLERAALCGEALRERDAVLARCMQLEEDLRQANQDAGGSWAESEMRFKDLWQEALDRRRGLCNVSRVLTWPAAAHVARSPDWRMFTHGVCR